MRPECFIYIFAPRSNTSDFPFVKVGIAANPDLRLQQIQTGCPVQMQVVKRYRFPNREIAKAVETAFHEVNCAFRSHGEWFSMKVDHAHVSACAAIEALLTVIFDTDDQPQNLSELAACYQLTVGDR